MSNKQIPDLAEVSRLVALLKASIEALKEETPANRKAYEKAFQDVFGKKSQ